MMRYATLAVLVATVGLYGAQTIAAAAQDVDTNGPALPNHDVDRACGSLGVNVLVSRCVKDEQFSYDALKRIWPILSQDGKSTAINSSRYFVDKPGYYGGLFKIAAAINEREQQRREMSSPPPRFQR